jgi:hypothetical protein
MGEYVGVVLAFVHVFVEVAGDLVVCGSHGDHSLGRLNGDQRSVHGIMIPEIYRQR